MATLAADTGTLRWRDDNGFNIGSVTTLNATVNGVTSRSADLSASNGAMTQDSDAALQVAGTLNLSGGLFELGGVNNNVNSLTANGVSLSLRDDDGFNVAGISMTNTACLFSNGNVTQSAAIVANAIGLGGNGIFNLNHANNDVNTLAASGQGLVYRDADGFDIGTVTPPAGAPKSGISVVDSVVLTGGGAVTQAAAISANGLALNGAADDFTLNLAGNTVATVAGNASRIAYSQSGSLAIGTVTGADASVTNGISVGDQVTLQTMDLLASLTLNSAVVAQGAGFAAVLATQRDVINNVGASALQTPNGNWALYANNPVTSVFNGLTAPTNVFENSIATLPPASLPAGVNAVVFQRLRPPVPPPQNPPAADFSGAGSQMLQLDAAVWAIAAIRAIVIIGGDNYCRHDACRVNSSAPIQACFPMDQHPSACWRRCI